MASLRDERIDILRGYAMLTISLNHVSWLFEVAQPGLSKVPTMTYYGYSSAAEIFILMAGYMVGMVYARRPDYGEKMVSRSWLLYRTYIAAFVALLALGFIFDPITLATTQLTYSITEPFRAIAMYALLLQAPAMTPILQMYVVFMLGAIPMIWTLRRWPVTVPIMSVLVYIIVQIKPGINLPGGNPGDFGRWVVNPFAYQLAFCLGLFFGFYNVHKAVFTWLDSSWLRAAAPVALLCIVTAFFLYDPFEWANSSLTSKSRMGPVRFLHAPFVIFGLLGLLSLTRTLHHTRAFRLLALTGRQTLYGYAWSIVATYIVLDIWIRANQPYWLYVFCAVLVAISVIGASAIAEALRSPSKGLARVS